MNNTHSQKSSLGDEFLFKLIQDNLKKSKALIDPSYVGKHWANYFSSLRAPKYLNPDYYSSFRDLSKTRLSKGFDDNATWPLTLNRLIKLLKLYSLNSIIELTENRIGKPPFLEIANIRYNFNDLRLIYFALQIKSNLNVADNPIFCEIGSGYGGLAHKLKVLFPNAKILQIDLPEAAATATFYLKSLHPSSQILTYQDFENHQKRGETSRSFFGNDFDFAILPPPLLSEAPDAYFDLFVNTRSMMEMKFSAIGNYFDLIQRKTKINGLFYNVNRYYKSTVGEPIRLRDYPYDAYWQVLLSQPSYFPPHIHELITRRTDTRSTDVQAALLNLPDQAYLCNNKFQEALTITKKVIKKFLRSLFLSPLRYVLRSKFIERPILRTAARYFSIKL